MGHQVVKSLISYLILLSVFITGEGLAKIGFTIYWYHIFYVPFAIFCIIVFHKINVKIFSAFAGIFLYSLVTHKTGIDLLGKQLVNLAFALIVFYCFLLYENFDLEEIFRKYVFVSKFILILGFVQVTFFLVNAGDIFITVFPFLSSSNISIRLQSLTQEPSYIAFTFAPVVFLSLHNLSYNTTYLIGRRWSFMFLLGYLLTMSSIAYIGLVVMILSLYMKQFSFLKLRFLLFVLAGTFLLAFVSYIAVPLIKSRVDDTLFGITHDFTNERTYRNVNLSTYALLSNLYVTKESLMEHPLAGNGLGTYEVVYDRYIPEGMKEYSALNKKDANSMGLRLLAETGIIGFFIFIFLVVRFRVNARLSQWMSNDIFWIINNGIFVLFLLALLRSGNYTIHGKILFLLLYYYTHEAAKKIKSSVMAQG